MTEPLDCPSEPAAMILDEMSDGLERSSAQISAATGLWTGKLYPTLHELEEAGRLVSRWEEGPAPRRRLYKLSPEQRSTTPVEAGDRARD